MLKKSAQHRSSSGQSAHPSPITTLFNAYANDSIAYQSIQNNTNSLRRQSGQGGGGHVVATYGKLATVPEQTAGSVPLHECSIDYNCMTTGSDGSQYIPAPQHQHQELELNNITANSRMDRHINNQIKI